MSFCTLAMHSIPQGTAPARVCRYFKELGLESGISHSWSFVFFFQARPCEFLRFAENHVLAWNFLLWLRQNVSQMNLVEGSLVGIVFPLQFEFGLG